LEGLERLLLCTAMSKFTKSLIFPLLVALALVHVAQDKNLLASFGDIAAGTDWASTAIVSASNYSSSSSGEPPILQYTVWTKKRLGENITSNLSMIRKLPKIGSYKVPVTFRPCHYLPSAGVQANQIDICPLKNPSEVYEDPLYKYLTDDDFSFVLYDDITATSPHQEWIPPFDASWAHSVTYWNGTHNIILWLRSSTKNLRIKPCRGAACPKTCPRPPQVPVTYFWDSMDALCKHPKPPVGYMRQCSCTTTCHTPALHVSNSTWPWKSEMESDAFPTSRGTCKHIHKQQRKALGANWSKPHFSCANSREDIQIPCPVFSDFSDHLFFVPQAKLIFCGIPKVGISEWIKFFRFVMGTGDYLSLPHYKTDIDQWRVSRLGNEAAQKLFQDPTWTKAVFLREPAERLLSAYQDKVVKHAFTQHHFKIDTQSPPETRKILSFEEFVNLVMEPNDNCKSPGGLDVCSDPHWKPQTLTCGLDYLLPHYDFIGNFHHVSPQTKLLLQQVNLWETHGSKFDDGSGRTEEMVGNFCASRLPHSSHGSRNTTIHGFNQRGPTTSAGKVHATGSSRLFDQLYTPELLAKVQKAYAPDYAVWNAIKDRDPGDVVSGKDVPAIHEYCNQVKV